MVMSATSLSDVSLMAMVPDNECKMPTLIGPLSSVAAGAAGCAPEAGFGSSGFEHPVRPLNNATATKPQY
jgi:hypothetical protein